MISIEGESISFCTPVETQGEMNGVERWLLKSEETMRKSLSTTTKEALEVCVIFFCLLECAQVLCVCCACSCAHV